MAIGLGILGLPIFSDYILPFALLFVVVFAILDKTEILGKEKKQINAIVAFIFALMFVAIGNAVSIIQGLIPIVGVMVVVILSFMLLFGFVGGQVNPMNKGLIITAGILILIAMIFTLLYFTGVLPTIQSWFTIDEILSTVILLVFIIAIFSVVLTTKSEPEKEKSGH